MNNFRNKIVHYELALSDGVKSKESTPTGDTALFAVDTNKSIVERFYELEGSKLLEFLINLKGGKNIVIEISESVKLDESVIWKKG